MDQTISMIEESAAYMNSPDTANVCLLGGDRIDEEIWEFAHRLAPVAAELLGCKALRLYQDCAFLKASHSHHILLCHKKCFGALTTLLECCRAKDLAQFR